MKTFFPLFCVCSVLAGQQPAVSGKADAKGSGAEATDHPLVIRSSTRLVQISAIVQDKKGQPVTDLTKADFEITEHGKAQTISLFSMETSNGSVTATTTAPPKLPPNIFTNSLYLKAGTPNSVTIVLLDNLNTKFEDQVYARQQFIKFLKQIQPEDHIAIYALGKGLRVLHDYTTDSSDLVRSLANYRGQNLPDLQASEPVMGAVSDSPDSALNGWLNGEDAVSDFYTANRVLETMQTLEYIANHVSRLPGRKNLIWLSAGVPSELGMLDADTFGDPTREHRQFGPEIERTVRAVNNANLSIYPVDARGLMADTRFSAVNRTVNISQPGSNPGLANQQTMQELADRTGGKAYYNTNDLKSAIRNALDDSRVTYTLGYYPSEEKFDGKFHDIKVKVLRAGVNVRFRKGYYDLPENKQDEKSRKEELRDVVWSPLEATGLPMLVQVGPSVDKKYPDDMNILVKFDAKSLGLDLQGDRYVGRVDLLFVQKDAKGKLLNTVNDTLDVKLLKATYERMMREGVLYRKAIPKLQAASSLRVVVREVASGTVGTVTVPFDQVSWKP